MYMCQVCKVPEGGFHHTLCISKATPQHPLGDLVLNPGHNLRDRDKVIAATVRRLRGLAPKPPE